MPEPLPLPEFLDNPESRCPVVLLLDTSGSMAGPKIAALEEGVRQFREAVLRDELASIRVEIAIVTFGPVSCLQGFTTVANFKAPALKASGGTPMGQAIEYGLELVSRRKATYREQGIPYYRPWIFLITDGEPEDLGPVQKITPRIHERERERKHSFFTIGVENANMRVLAQIAPPERPPMHLTGLDFKAMFHWLSASVIRVSTSVVGSEMVALPPITWGTPHERG